MKGMTGVMIVHRHFAKEVVHERRHMAMNIENTLSNDNHSQSMARGEIRIDIDVYMLKRLHAMQAPTNSTNSQQ